MMPDRQKPVSPQQGAPHGGGPVRMMEIGGVGVGGRWKRWLGFVLFYLLVAAALVWVFRRFGAPFALAVGLVGFMIGYMVLMGAAAGRNLKK